MRRKTLQRILEEVYAQGVMDGAQPKMIGVSVQSQIADERFSENQGYLGFGFRRNEERINYED